jgi:N-dimethylarginine dimethylaminohydrolase
VGLWELLGDLGIATVAVPDDEYPTLGCNVLAVRPRVVVVAEGNPVTAAALRAAGCEVHAFPAGEIGVNGGGGPTCLTRPVLRG